MELEQLLDVWDKLAVRERKVLLTFAMRLWAGQRRHGELSLGKKDWNYEAIEEALDASCYLACLLNDRSEKAFAAMVTDAEKELETKDMYEFRMPAPGNYTVAADEFNGELEIVVT